jgi:Flp pilus assembly protein TadD
LEHSLTLAPSLAEAHVELGKLSLANQNPVGAIAHFGAALAWEPDNANIHLLRAKALVKAQQWSDAVQELQTTIRLQPGSDAYRYLGTALTHLGRSAEAAESFRLSKELASAKR